MRIVEVDHLNPTNTVTHVFFRGRNFSWFCLKIFGFSVNFQKIVRKVEIRNFWKIFRIFWFFSKIVYSPSETRNPKIFKFFRIFEKRVSIWSGFHIMSLDGNIVAQITLWSWEGNLSVGLLSSDQLQSSLVKSFRHLKTTIFLKYHKYMSKISNLLNYLFLYLKMYSEWRYEIMYKHVWIYSTPGLIF